MALRVLNMMGDEAAAAARAAVTDVEIVPVPWGDDLDLDALKGEVLFAAWHGHPLVQHLDDLGVRWMHLPGTGIDSWPRHLLEGRTVTCSRGVSAIPIAEFVLGGMLAFEKDFPKSWLAEPPEHWNLAQLGELAGKTLGLVGLGGIGMAVATRALAFEMKVRALRRTAKPASDPGIEVVTDLGDLLASADHLVLAAPGTGATRHLLDADAFAAMKPGVHLVNIARGSLVDQDALLAALDDDRVAMASLDTVDPEPLPAGHWMYSHPKVRLSAHVSWSSPNATARMFESFAANLRRYVDGEPLDGVIDLDEGY
ncbi:MAG: NAD(P)-dependent oxidoreductase [Acidimicrobiia bacterium]